MVIAEIHLYTEVPNKKTVLPNFYSRGKNELFPRFILTREHRKEIKSVDSSNGSLLQVGEFGEDT